MEFNKTTERRRQVWSASPYSKSAVSSSASYTIEHLIYEILSAKIKKIVVMTGAGISTASGIPDFRSPGTGLYYNLTKFRIPYPEAVFEKDYFRRNPRPFFALAKDLLPNIDKYKPNRIHYFLRLLQDKRLLHRLYTQNIDGLECLSGIQAQRLVEAHGSFRSAQCIDCHRAYSGVYMRDEILNDRIPTCRFGQCAGLIKPDIVFFGEDLPESFYRRYEADFSAADCILVMGTSLKVEPFANLVAESRQNIPRLLVNKESVGPFKLIKLNRRSKDLQLLGDLVSGVDSLVEKLGWKADLELLIMQETRNIETLKVSILDEMYYKFAQNLKLGKESQLSMCSSVISQDANLTPLKPPPPLQHNCRNIVIKKVGSFDDILPSINSTTTSTNILNRKPPIYATTTNSKRITALSITASNTSMATTTTTNKKKKQKKKKKKQTRATTMSDPFKQTKTAERKKTWNVRGDEETNHGSSCQKHSYYKIKKEKEEASNEEDEEESEEEEEDQDEEYYYADPVSKEDLLCSNKNETTIVGSNKADPKSSQELIKSKPTMCRATSLSSVAQQFVNANDKRLSVYNKFNKNYMSSFIFNKYSIHVKLLNNLNKYNEFLTAKETANPINASGLLNRRGSRDDINKTSGNSETLTVTSEALFENNDDSSSDSSSSNSSEQISAMQRVLYKTTLSTANSKPLLAKRVQSASSSSAPNKITSIS